MADWLNRVQKVPFLSVVSVTRYIIIIIIINNIIYIRHKDNSIVFLLDRLVN